MCVLPISFPHHTIVRRRPQRYPPNAASVEEQGDDHCGNEPCLCVPSWRSAPRSAHQGEMCIPSTTHAGWEDGVINCG